MQGRHLLRDKAPQQAHCRYRDIIHYYTMYIWKLGQQSQNTIRGAPPCWSNTASEKYSFADVPALSKPTELKLLLNDWSVTHNRTLQGMCIM